MSYRQISDKIVVWKKTDNSYYYRVYHKILDPFEIGYHNRYGHEVVLIINDLQEKRLRRKKSFLSQRKKNKLIDFINNL